MDPEQTGLGEMVDPTRQADLLQQIPGDLVPTGADPESTGFKATDIEDIFPSLNLSTKSCPEVPSQDPPPQPSKSTHKTPVIRPSSPSSKSLISQSKPGRSTGTKRKENRKSAPPQKKGGFFNGMIVKHEVMKATTDNKRMRRIRSLLAKTPECIEVNAFLTHNEDYISPYLLIKGYMKLVCDNPRPFAHRYLGYLLGVVDSQIQAQVTEKVNLQAQADVLLKKLQVLYDRNDETIREHKEGAERVLVAIETAHDKLHSLINELTPPTGQNLPSVTTSNEPAITTPNPATYESKTAPFSVTNGTISVYFNPTHGWSTGCFVPWKDIPHEGLWKGMLTLIKKIPKEQAKLVAPMTMSDLLTAYLESDKSLETFLQKLKNYDSKLKTN